LEIYLARDKHSAGPTKRGFMLNFLLIIILIAAVEV